MQNTHTDLENLIPTALDAGLIFSGKASGKLIQGYDQASAYTPVINPDYIFHESSRDIIVWLMNPADPLYVFGPVGCGKSSCIKQLAARLNYPVFEITGHGRLEFSDLVGHLTVKDNNMVFEHGPLSLAMKYGGIILLNEIDLTPPEIATGLNSVLDGSPLCIAENGGELITPHPMFRFVATANTNGSGDETGLYQGTQRQNLAWLDRFTLCEIGYPSPDVEKVLLARKFPEFPSEISEKMVDYAGEVRKLFMGAGGESDTHNLSGAIEVTLSTRTLLRWAELTMRFQPLAHQGIQPVTYALDRALAYRASRETRAMLHELAQRIFPVMENPQVDFVTKQSACEGVPFDSTDPEVWLRQAFYHLHGEPNLQRYPRLAELHMTKQDHRSNKFWHGHLEADGISITWGRINTKGQSVRIEKAQCLHNDPAQELLNRCVKKLKNGYTFNAQETFIPKEI